MTGWKLLAATPLLLVPLAVVGASVADGPELESSAPVLVLPAAEEPPVTMRREGAGRQPRPTVPRSDPAPAPDCSDDLDDDEQDDDELDDDGLDDDGEDGVLVVHPCPGAVGDDENDDDRGEGGEDDSDETGSDDD